MKSFYRKIQDKLYAHRSPVNTDELWQQINTELHPKKKRRIFLWWGLSILFLLGGGIAIWQSSPTSLFTQGIPTLVMADEGSTTPESSSSDLTESKDFDLKDHPIKMVNTPTTNSDATSPFQQPSPQRSIKPVSEIPFSNQPPLLLTLKNDKPDDSVSTQIITPATDQLSDQLARENKIPEVKSKPLKSLPAPTIASRLSKAEAISSYTPEFTEAAPLDLYRKGKSSSLELGIHASLFRPTSQFKAATTVHQQLLNDRVRTESPLEAIELGLSISYFRPEGFYLKTGLSFTQINEQFEWQNTSYRRDTLDGILLQVELNEQGDTISRSFGSGMGTTTSSYQAKIYNSIRLFDLPIIAGYHIQRSSWHFGLETGIYFNLSQMAEGRILDTYQQVRNLETTSILKKRVGLSLYGAIRMSYQLTDQWAISFAPNLRYQLDRNTRQDYELEQRYHLFGMQIGVGYQF